MGSLRFVDVFFCYFFVILSFYIWIVGNWSLFIFFQFTFYVISFESWASHVNLNLLELFFLKKTIIQFCSLTLGFIFFFANVLLFGNHHFFLIRFIYYPLFFCLKIILLKSIRSITYCHFFIYFFYIIKRL